MGLRQSVYSVTCHVIGLARWRLVFVSVMTQLINQIYSKPRNQLSSNYTHDKYLTCIHLLNLVFSTFLSIATSNRAWQLVSWHNDTCCLSVNCSTDVRCRLSGVEHGRRCCNNNSRMSGNWDMVAQHLIREMRWYDS